MALNFEPQVTTCTGEWIRAAHPLLQQAASNSLEKCYTSRFDGSEFFLRDHRLNGARVVPGACLLEMARAALAASLDGESNRKDELELRQVVFLRPIVVDAPLNVHIRLRGEDDGRIGFEIYTRDSSAGATSDEIVHAKGRASVAPRTNDAESRIDVHRLLATCAQSIDVDRCYAAFDSVGMSYGPTLRVLERLHMGSHPDGRSFVLGRVTVSDDDDWPSQGLHPSIVDAALQACIGLGSLASRDGMAEAGKAKGAALPFALERARIVAPCARSAWVLAQRSAAGSSVPPSGAARLQKFDIDVLDDDGAVCVALRGFEAVDRTEAVAAAHSSSAAPAQAAGSAGRLREATEAALIAAVAQELRVARGDVAPDAELSELGCDSIALTSLAEALSRTFAVELSPTLFFEYSTIRSLVDFLVATHGLALVERLGACDGVRDAEAGPLPADSAAAMRSPPAAAEPREGSRDTAPPRPAEPSPIAVIGMSGRFPGGVELEAFWETLVTGKDCISPPSPAWRDDASAFGGADATARLGGYIEGIDELDAAFFGISADEARLMDPNQRLLLTYAWKAIEDAGYAPRSLWGSRTGVFVAITGSGYGELVARAGVGADALGAVGAVPSIGPNRLSHCLNLRGPSEPVETACSSSLVAIHRAMRALRDGECDFALVGGVNTIISARAHDMFSGAGMLSPDGRCRPFSKQANGYVRGEGVGMLLLKRASAAERDGDHIYGLLRAAAASHGGRASSLTAPNPRAQADIVKAVLAEANVDPATVTYIETHGTGTALGDAVEVTGLRKAFAELQTAHTARCGLGSVKGNTGHLELAAGIASVIKVLLQMQHRTLAATLHCQDLNPHIDFEGGPFYVVRESQPWKPEMDADGPAVPRRAGVSAFGFGGVNAHVLLEEYVEPPSSASAPGPVVIVLSAKTRSQLRQQAAQLASAIARGRVTDSDLASAAYTLQVGRDAMAHRLAVAVHSAAQLAEKLEAFAAGREPRGVLVGGPDVCAGDAGAPLGERPAHRGPTEREADALMAAWARGANVDWTQLYRSSSRPRRMSLPTYPFLHERHWVLDSAKDRAKSAAARPVRHGVTGAEQFLVRTIADIRGCSAADIDTSLGFLELGLSSYELLEVAGRIERVVGNEVSPVLLFEHASFRELAGHLESMYAQAAPLWSSSSASESHEPDADEEPVVFRDFRMGKVTLDELLGVLRAEGERLLG